MQSLSDFVIRDSKGKRWELGKRERKAIQRERERVKRNRLWWKSRNGGENIERKRGYRVYRVKRRKKKEKGAVREDIERRRKEEDIKEDDGKIEAKDAE